MWRMWRRRLPTCLLVFCCLAPYYVTSDSLASGQRRPRDRPQEIPDEQRLIDKLLDGYHMYSRPVFNASEKVVVKFGLTLVQISDMDEVNQVLTINVWLEQEWDDERLIWDPKDYNGLQILRIPCEKIWLPDIVLYNSADDFTTGYMKSKAMVRHTGNVFWPPPAKFRSSCKIDITYFPFDDQECELKFGSWTYDGFQVDITNRSAAVDLKNYVYSGEWELLDVKIRRTEMYYECCDEPYPDVRFTIIIRRKTLYYLFNIIFPCLWLTILSLLGFWLPPDSGEKITLGITVLLAFSVFMLLIAESMPATSEFVPLIGIYLTVTMAMTSLSIILTVLVLQLHHVGPHQKRVPRWMWTLVIDVLAPLVCLCHFSHRYSNLHAKTATGDPHYRVLDPGKPEDILLNTFDADVPAVSPSGVSARTNRVGRGRGNCNGIIPAAARVEDRGDKHLGREVPRVDGSRLDLDRSRRMGNYGCGIPPGSVNAGLTPSVGASVRETRSNMGVCVNVSAKHPGVSPQSSLSLDPQSSHLSSRREEAVASGTCGGRPARKDPQFRPGEYIRTAQESRNHGDDQFGLNSPASGGGHQSPRDCLSVLADTDSKKVSVGQTQKDQAERQLQLNEQDNDSSHPWIRQETYSHPGFSSRSSDEMLPPRNFSRSGENVSQPIPSNLDPRTGSHQVSASRVNRDYQNERITQHLQVLISRDEADDRHRDIVTEWRVVAHVMDRLLFWLFLIVAIVSSVIILIIKPLTKPETWQKN